jgi:hypothetical protein
LIINYDGQQYPFDLDDVTVKQAIKIEKYMGCSFEDWGKKLQEGGSLPARQALGWLILQKGDLAAAIDDTDFKLVALAKGIDEAFAAEAAKAKAAEDAAPVPTVAVASNGHTPAAASSPVNSPPSSGEISR